MNLDKISIGKNPPHDVNVVIEVPMNAAPVKYEFDKEIGAPVVDRFLSTPMYYPCNYGFIPHTMADDGDPLDVLVVSRYPLIVGCVINVKPIGVILMSDEKGNDEKIIAVPSGKLHKAYNDVNHLSDLPQGFLAEIIHFFERYKDLEDGKWVKVTGSDSAEKAREVILSSIEKK